MAKPLGELRRRRLLDLALHLGPAAASTPGATSKADTTSSAATMYKRLPAPSGLRQPAGHGAADQAAEDGAGADDGEQALGFARVEQVIGEQPELRDQHQPEHADQK